MMRMGKSIRHMRDKLRQLLSSVNALAQPFSKGLQDGNEEIQPLFAIEMFKLEKANFSTSGRKFMLT